MRPFEETHASEGGGFAPDLEKEIRRLEACDFFPGWGKDVKKRFRVSPSTVTL